MTVELKRIIVGGEGFEFEGFEFERFEFEGFPVDKNFEDYDLS